MEVSTWVRKSVFQCFFRKHHSFYMHKDPQSIMKGLRFGFSSTSSRGAFGFRKGCDMIGLMISRHNHHHGKNRQERGENGSSQKWNPLRRLLAGVAVWMERKHNENPACFKAQHISHLHIFLNGLKPCLSPGHYQNSPPSVYLMVAYLGSSSIWVFFSQPDSKHFEGNGHSIAIPVSSKESACWFSTWPHIRITWRAFKA